MITLFTRLLLSFSLLVALPTSALAQSLEIPLRMDMNYVEARQKLIDLGWQHDGLPVYGYGETDQKVASECGTVEICNEYPEIDSCGSGYCSMLFYDHDQNVLSVVTYGDLESKGAYVTGWQLVK